MRPVYDSEAQREHTDDIALEFWMSMVGKSKARFGRHIHRMKEFAHTDYCCPITLKAGSTFLMIEVKNRKHPYGSFPDLFISHAKWKELVYDQMWHPNIVVGSWSDGTIKWAPVDLSYPVSWFGAEKYRGDTQDAELVVNIPITAFREPSECISYIREHITTRMREVV